MQNAAYQLAAIFESWYVPQGHNLLEIRQKSADRAGCDLQRHMADVLALVRSLDATLCGMQTAGEDVEAWRELVPFWMDVALAPTTNWATISSASSAAIAVDHLRGLRMLGAYLAAVGPGALDDAQVARLPGLLSQMRELIDETASIKPAAHAYLLALASQIEHIVAHGSEYGDDLLRHATVELSGALNVIAQSDDVSSGNRPKWHKLATWFALTVFTPPIVALGEVGRDYIKELGPGAPAPATVVVHVDPGNDAGNPAP